MAASENDANSMQAALPNEQTINYKLSIVGDVGTGKTTFLNRHVTGAARKHSDSNFGVEVYPLEFKTNHGIIRFYCWDPIQEALPDSIFTTTDCAIVMYDITSVQSYQKARQLHKQLQRVCQSGIPIIVCANKLDVCKKAMGKNVNFRGIDHCYISALSNFNFETPFLRLARNLTGDQNLCLMESTALSLPERPPPHLNFVARLQREISGKN